MLSIDEGQEGIIVAEIFSGGGTGVDRKLRWIAKDVHRAGIMFRACQDLDSGHLGLHFQSLPVPIDSFLDRAGG